MSIVLLGSVYFQDRCVRLFFSANSTTVVYCIQTSYYHDIRVRFFILAIISTTIMYIFHIGLVCDKTVPLDFIDLVKAEIKMVKKMYSVGRKTLLQNGTLWLWKWNFIERYMTVMEIRIAWHVHDGHGFRISQNGTRPLCI